MVRGPAAPFDGAAVPSNDSVREPAAPSDGTVPLDRGAVPLDAPSNDCVLEPVAALDGASSNNCVLDPAAPFVGAASNDGRCAAALGATLGAAVGAENDGPRSRAEKGSRAEKDGPRSRANELPRSLCDDADEKEDVVLLEVEALLGLYSPAASPLNFSAINPFKYSSRASSVPPSASQSKYGTWTTAQPRTARHLLLKTLRPLSTLKSSVSTSTT
mmetsp:Transcript_18543/g.63892  ORF Transcript_18543/g.63892 Transcript_18543/m.63892 type:complete len:216 (-) Transcript_18543:405-1052(-)